MTSTELFFKKELAKEIRNVSRLMKDETNAEKKLYYFSAAYGVAGRTYRYAFTKNVLLAELVLQTSYSSIMDRIMRIKSGDVTVPLDEKVFETIVDGLKKLADAIETDAPIQEALEIILTASFSTSGPGYYLMEKHMFEL
jgi:hypothetical protein